MYMAGTLKLSTIRMKKNRRKISPKRMTIEALLILETKCVSERTIPSFSLFIVFFVRPFLAAFRCHTNDLKWFFMSNSHITPNVQCVTFVLIGDLKNHIETGRQHTIFRKRMPIRIANSHSNIVKATAAKQANHRQCERYEGTSLWLECVCARERASMCAAKILIYTIFEENTLTANTLYEHVFGKSTAKTNTENSYGPKSATKAFDGEKERVSDSQQY